MGFNGFETQMETRTRSVSSGLASSSGLRGKTPKSSPFYPHSSTKLTKSIIKDHMVSHYKKIYSAKAAIDTSVPKSLLQSVKYKDQIRKEQLRNGVRPQSALSFSQRNSRTSCLSAQYDDRPYLCSRSSVISSSKFTSSFNNKDVVYPSNKVSAHYSRPSSEMKYQSPDFQRKQSTFSLGALRDQDCYKAFQDPVKKTYSGDLLQKHSQHFTQEKPFTPKTLKSEKSSYLSKYRYYRAPKIKSSQEGSNSGQMQQETCEQSAENRKSTQESEEPSQECSAEHEWFGDQVYRTALSPSGQEGRKTKADPFLFSSLSRALPEDTAPSFRRGISAEEEELMYLEFISAVTEDILSKGHISDSIIDRVMNRHIDMNLHRLDEGKMCHLLEVLRKELEQPASTDHLKEEHDSAHSVFLHLQSGLKHVKTEEDRDGLTQYDDFLLDSALLTGSTMISEDAANNEDNNEESVHQVDATAVNIPDDYVHTSLDSDQKQADIHNDGQFEELEYLGKTLSEVLHVSSNTQSEDVETAQGPHTNSDDEF